MIMYYEEFQDYLVNQKSNSANTKESYLRDVLYFQRYLTHIDIESPCDADENTIKNYVDYLKELGRSNSTISRTISSLRCFYKFLLENRLVDRNPAQKTKPEKVTKKLPQVLNGEEIELLLKQPNVTDAKGCRDKAMLELLYATGIRVSELIELDVSDINLKTGVLTCRNPKGIRSIPVHSSAIVAVSDYIFRMRTDLVFKENDALFLNLNGGRLTRQGFWKIIKGYAEKCTSKELTPHTLRHSFAMHLLENGASVKDIQTMMGHADISSTQVYVQLLDNHVKVVYNECHPKAKKD